MCRSSWRERNPSPKYGGLLRADEMTTPRAALTVDLEWFTHLPAYRSARGATERSAVGREGAETLLSTFDEADALGTFYVVSGVAEDHSALLSRTAEAGHEIGSHTHTHRHLTELSSEQRREELADSRRLLEETTGAAVTGFRAPSFDFGTGHFQMLEETGYSYDSSVNPCRSIPGWYGGEYDHKRPVPANEIDPAAPASLAEVPIAVMPWLGLPLTGTWIRFFGVRYTILGMRWLARRDIAPVLYVHPWELVDLPAVEEVPKRVYWRTGAFMRNAVRRILAEPFEFVRARELATEATECTDGGELETEDVR
jgi:peptidoglycan/xylan/chitin deacetylase (PgdA/CDA1 family)